jgi:hypothetical protein
LLSTVTLTRILPIEQFGLYVFAYTAMTIVSVPTRAGVPQLVLRTTAYALKNEERSELGARWKWATRLTFLVSGLSMLLLGALLLPASGISVPEFLLAALLIPIISLANTRTSALRALGRPLVGQMPELVLRPGLFLILLLAAALIKEQGTIRLLDVLFLNVMASFLILLFTLWMLRRVAREKGVGGSDLPAERISGGLRAAATLHADQGDYSVTDEKLLAVLARPGEHALLFTIVTPQDSDLLDATLRVADAASADATHDGHDHGPDMLSLLWWAVAAAAALAAGALLLRRRFGKGGLQ